MNKYIVGIDGMACSMCEAHMNDAVRQNFKVKKVNSSHSKNETVIVTDEDIAEEALSKIISETGYRMTSFERQDYEKKGLFKRK